MFKLMKGVASIVAATAVAGCTPWVKPALGAPDAQYWACYEPGDIDHRHIALVLSINTGDPTLGTVQNDNVTRTATVGMQGLDRTWSFDDVYQINLDSKGYAITYNFTGAAPDELRKGTSIFTCEQAKVRR